MLTRDIERNRFFQRAIYAAARVRLRSYIVSNNPIFVANIPAATRSVQVPEVKDEAGRAGSSLRRN